MTEKAVADDRDQVELAWADIKLLIEKGRDPMGMAAVRFLEPELVRLLGIEQRAREIADPKGYDAWERDQARHILGDDDE